MLHHHYSTRRRAPRRNLLLTAALVAISISPVAFFADLHRPGDAPAASSSIASRPPAQEAVRPALARTYDPALVDPTPALKPEALVFANNAPLAAALRRPPVPLEARAAPQAAPGLPAEPAPSAQAVPPAQVVSPAQAVPLAPSAPPALETAQAAQPVPLPAPRPAEWRVAKIPEAAPTARAPMFRPARVAAAPSAPANNPSFFEKLFGLKPASPPESALGYASLDSTGSIAPTSRFDSTPAPAAGAGTAVYDISARMVIMPNGERLEAHSGLGDKLDDPRFVHVRMRGATPPGTYELTERERLFHGVRAIRLNPVGGSAAIYGRDGILAHTYMLGPNGDSNGCVSFKNYDRFLQAYLRGEVKRLVVVTGRGQDVLPRIVNRRSGRAT